MGPPAESPVRFRFYEELNDFLPEHRKKREFELTVRAPVSVKDAIESAGVPHPEVDLILVDGVSVGFDHLLRGGERVAVYPVFEALDISSIQRLRPAPLRDIRFIADVHLRKLARDLRLLGFDASYARDIDDAAIVEVAVTEQRVILTRDVGLLKRRAVTHGIWVRSTDPEQQIAELLERLDLASRARPFTRCLACNAPIEPADKEDVLERLPPRVRERETDFLRCLSCGRVYWRGTHFEKLEARVQRLLGRTP